MQCIDGSRFKKNVSELSQEDGEDHYGNDGKLSRYLLNLD